MLILKEKETIMKTTDVAIIGGSAAGLTAAVTLRMRYPQKRVTVLRNVTQTLVPCGIPYIFGTMKGVEKNVVPDEMFTGMGIEIVQDNVEQIDRQGNELVLTGGKRLGYRKLILGTGSSPFLPAMPGIALENVFAIHKDPVYLQKLFTALEQAQRVVIVGGGFIGVEMAEQITRMDRAPGHVTLVEALPHCLMQAVEEEFCRDVESALRQKGIVIRTGSRVAAIAGEDRACGVKLENGEVLEADLVLVGLGARPNIDLAERAGLACAPQTGIAVNEYLQTEDPDILVAGDCASKFSPITGGSSEIRLGSTACSEGMIAACNLFGPSRKTAGAVGAFATLVGEMGIGAVGLTAMAARNAGIDVVITEAAGPNRHPGHLPGGTPDLKAVLLFRKDDGRIVGGHIRGDRTAADMINIVAVAIQAGLTAEQLATMQYATHPMLTAAPSSYQIMFAAEQAAARLAA